MLRDHEFSNSELGDMICICADIYGRTAVSDI